ncbi:DNA ligase 3 isoform X2 [Anabrus simplex]
MVLIAVNTRRLINCEAATWYFLKFCHGKYASCNRCLCLVYDSQVAFDLWYARYLKKYCIWEQFKMSDEESTGDEKKFFAERAKTGRATCKKCKQKLETGKLRLAKAGYNPFGPGPMKLWHHVECLFDVFSRQRATTARINSPDDIEGWDNLEEEDKEAILKFLPNVGAGTSKEGTRSSKETGKISAKDKVQKKGGDDKWRGVPGHKDNSFREFRRLLVDLSNENTYTGKTAIIRKLFESGSDGDGFKGDMRLWVKLLLPGVNQRVYNLKSKQLVKLFSKIFRVDHGKMLEHLEQGDVAVTIATFFEESKNIQPTKKSTLTLQEVDHYLEELSKLTKEDDQMDLFTQVARRCTTNDLMIFIRLIKHDLRINAGPKHILDAVHPDAYQAFQASRDLNAVLSQALEKKGAGVSSPTKKTNLNIGVQVMTPVLPMLAEACKSVDYAMKKCPNGMYSEIKYDGERVQVHKQGSEFKYFSRSLKTVMPHKVNHFKDYIPQAFPSARELILDSEVLMVDTKTGKPLPFGTLGVHKRGEYKDASVCLFVFDCIYYNGESLTKKPLKERRDILHEVMTEIPNHIMFSEMEEVHKSKDLEAMITKVFKLGLEGLVLKDLLSQYEPGKRHWLKIKKDYLFGGAMADTADLVVLGAWFGTGQKGGMMSVFLMGCWDPVQKKWCTVTKVHTGHDDKTLERLQSELKMKKISRDPSQVPSWLKCTKTMIPDFVAKDPKEMPVWEITGAEFTQHEVHTADGISIRFPRVTRIRDDKTWETATSLPELKELYQKSKQNADFSLPTTLTKNDDMGETGKKVTPIKSEKAESSSPRATKGESHRKAKASVDLMNDEKNSEPHKSKKSKQTLASTKIPEPPGIKKYLNYEDKPSKKLKIGNESKSPIEADEQHSKHSSKKQSSESQSYDDHQPLPDVFEDVRIVLPDSIAKEHQTIARYFVAYGGELLSDAESHLSTHVLHQNHTITQDEVKKWPSSACHVHVSWLIDSVKLQKKQKVELYAVTVKETK